MKKALVLHTHVAGLGVIRALGEMGVPVVALGDAPYAELANDCYGPDLFNPPQSVRRAYFARLAYAQWTLGEVRAGKPQEWLIEKGLTKKRNQQ